VTKAETALRRSLIRPERDQHSDMVIERVSDTPGAMNARAMPSIERMARRGLLSHRQAHAGQRLYQCWALGIVGARDGDSGGCTVFDPGGYTDRQLDAAREYRGLRDAVGLRLWSLTWNVACNDWSCERWANEIGGGMDRKGVIALLRHALDLAADHLGLPDT
jgi:hypothetical protein